ncbi:unnamed protein product [Arabidopsis lyrata]|uniref:Predicted protein n=1 Tax=Arabidopsis lyrata subsp. lyrata TaxID=81972 RepID=D7MIA2_ARALL|nr:probable E3 ubiquitin protein ligase DRIPH [Arabidopsis lyrata subsp. lyrata]EFH46777.1 predicted protein [Arabidopsis lyrata subsp. lyrata]CAH8277246.1 unnamed protein product [Arabidopsis lyrata]|eukprot:XP_002870518.1 probable E3 ubiquitin protein ligase DRIPH [Arabidopsis lyrata subsp. lyrata]
MSTMVKSEEAKLENDNPKIVEQVKLSNGFEDQKSSPLPNEETKEETSRGETSGEKPGKEKGVVQDTLQDRISSVATKKRNTPIWFRLVASNQDNTIAPLQQISSSSIRVKNSNMQLSFIKKYLVKKLDLKSENEVELYLENEPLDSSIMLPDLWQYWISTKKDVDVRNVKVGSSGADYIMAINYGRKSGNVI